MYAASAFAANMIVRSAVGAAFPLFTTHMFEGMGVNWASTLIGGVAVLLAPMPFIFYKYGPRIRQKSKFAPCIVRYYFFRSSLLFGANPYQPQDLKIAEQLEAERRTAQEMGVP